MAHHHQYQPPPPFAGELDGSGRPQLEGEIFEMPAESVATTTKEEQTVQANPWPFYLDQDVRTETRAEEEDGVKAGDGGAKGKTTEQPLANPWAYFGPEVDEDKDGQETKSAAVVESNVGGLGIKIEDKADSKAKSEDASLVPPPLHHHSSQDERGGHDASPLSPPLTTSDYPQPLRLSRKQVPTAAAAPAFKPYLPPAESSTAAVAPLKVRHQRASSEGGDLAALPYRPYRPAGHITPPVSKVDDRLDVAASSAMLPLRPASSSSSSPPKSHGSLVTGAVAPHRTPSPQTTSSASPNLVPQQHRIAESSGSADGLLNGAAPHRSTSPAVAAGFRPPSVPPPAPPVSGPVPTVAIAVVEPPAVSHASQHAVPQTTSVPSHHPLPSPSASSPALGGPSNSTPALGHLPASSPAPSHQAYAPPHSAPSSSIPSPEMASYPFQPINQAQPQNLYPVPTPTPPTASPGHPASMFYPPPQQYTPPPPPTSSYDIPQRTYATPAEIPPPQPPRPQYQQAPAGAYSPQPQPSPQSPSPYMFADVSRPVTQPPSFGQSSAYNLPYGPAVALHQHQYPTQPTYAAAPNNDVPSSPDETDAYASPPLPPRPATTQGSLPQVIAGFTPHVVAYPPPPRRVFDPPPAAATPPPRKGSGGTSSGRLFSSSSALKWIDKRGKGLENRLDAVLGSQGPSNRPPPQPPRPS
ncbi:hypothetical protein ACHAQJ_004782 [Trichoderma viride]